MNPMVKEPVQSALLLPSCAPPSLENLVVSVPPCVPLTPHDLTARLVNKARSLAFRRDRIAGENLAMGDEVLVDTVGYCNGKLVPFSARFGFWLDLEPLDSLPGFSEAVAQGAVARSLQINLNFPSDFPVAAFRNLPARFIVDIRGAREVTPVSLDSPAFLAQLKVANLDAAMNLVRDELEAEQQATLSLQATNMVLDELARRSNPVISRPLVDEEIRRRWVATEGNAMVARDYDVAEQEEAVQTWLRDEAVRADCERRLRVSVTLKAMVEAEKLTLSPEKLESLVVKNVAQLGLSAAEVAQGLRESTESTKQIVEMGWHLMAVEFAMSKAIVTFQSASLL